MKQKIFTLCGFVVFHAGDRPVEHSQETWHYVHSIISHKTAYGNLRYRKEIPELYRPMLQWHCPPWSSNWLYSGFCQPHMQKKMQRKCVYNLCVPCDITCMFLFMLRLQYIRSWWIMVILIAEKPWIPLIGAPCLDKGGTGSGISTLYLWWRHSFGLSCLHKPMSVPSANHPVMYVNGLFWPQGFFLKIKHWL